MTEKKVFRINKGDDVVKVEVTVTIGAEDLAAEFGEKEVRDAVVFLGNLAAMLTADFRIPRLLSARAEDVAAMQFEQLRRLGMEG